MCTMKIATKFSSCLWGHKGNLFEWLFVCVGVLHWNYMGKTIIFFLLFHPSICFGLCRVVPRACYHVVNETWKNDNKYYNQISTWKMTSSRNLLNSVHKSTIAYHILTYRILYCALWVGWSIPISFNMQLQSQLFQHNYFVISVRATQLIIHNLFKTEPEPSCFAVLY